MNELTLKFKGLRNYVQGGDFYNAVENWCKKNHTESTYVSKISFRTFTVNQCELLFTKPTENRKIIGSGVVTVVGEVESLLEFWLVEREAFIKDRYAYDEEGLVKKSIVSLKEKEIRLSSDKQCSIIEEIIAITKKINYAVSPDVNGKWVFGQLDLTQSFPSEYKEVSVKVTKMLANRFSVNEIKVDGKLVGNMRFIVGSP